MDIEHIVRSGFTDEQGPQASRKYMAYASSYALRVALGMVDADQVQELHAERQQIDNESDISSVASSHVSDIVDGINIEGTRFVVDYDRAEQSGSNFPWSAVQSLLGQPDTVYDVPIQRIVIRFSADDFTTMWKNKISDAVDDPNFPTNWIQEPFYAVLESSRPDNDGREKVKSDHEDRYFLPKSNTTSNGQQGLGWTPRVLDLESIWSHRGWSESNDSQLEAWSDRQNGGNWTPKRIEQRLMNFFEPDLHYTGMLRDDELMNKWREVIARGHTHDYTSFKTFAWEDEEEWMLQS
jgi:hypothetical protein